MNAALVALAGTVTVDGTRTDVLLLDRFTIRPLLPAAAFSVMVQPSVVGPVRDALPQVSALNVPAAATPAPLILTTAAGLVDELLVMERVPVNELTWGDVNVIVNVAFCPGLSVTGAVTPDAVKSDPATEMPEIVTGAVPVEVKTTGCEDVCPTVTLP